MKAIVVIPARMGSSRFPGKPLKNILGLPMIEHCYKRACLSEAVEKVYVATCDLQIKEHVESIGGNVVMTSNKHKRASTRTEEAVSILKKSFNLNPDVVIMLQGDEPLIRPDSISDLINNFNSNNIQILNLIAPIKNKEQFLDKNNVKVVFDKSKNNLYFSREPIPSSWIYKNVDKKFMQIGVMAFTYSSLRTFNKLEESSLEIYESVDMNRVIENGGKINLSTINYEMLGVDSQNDLERVEEIMKKDPILKLYD